MHYDYKNILTVEDLYLISEGNSSSLMPPPQQFLQGEFPKKSEISAYLIMQRIAKKNPKITNFRQLLEKFKSKYSKTSAKFIEDNSKLLTSQLSIIKDDLKNEIVEKKKKKKKGKRKRKFNFDPTISDPDSHILQKERVRLKLEKTKDPLYSNQRQLKKRRKPKLENIALENKTPPFSTNDPIQSANPIRRKIRFKPYILRNPRNRRAIMQDFNDYYDHFSDDDKVVIPEFSEMEDNEFESEDVPNETQNQTLPENVSRSESEPTESQSESEDFKTFSRKSATPFQKEAEERLPSIKKEVSFQMQQKPRESSLSPKKSHSLSKSRTGNRSSLSVVNKEDFKNDNVNEGNSDHSRKSGVVSKEKPVNGENPYIPIIERLLKSQDIFSEDIAEMMGIEEKPVEVPEQMIFLEESEKEFYRKIVGWNNQIEKLLKKDAKDLRKYEKRMQGMFLEMQESEQQQESEDDEGEEYVSDEEN